MRNKKERKTHAKERQSHALLFGSGRVVEPDQTKLSSTKPNTVFGFAEKKSTKREIKNENNRREKGSRGITRR